MVFGRTFHSRRPPGATSVADHWAEPAARSPGQTWFALLNAAFHWWRSSPGGDEVQLRLSPTGKDRPPYPGRVEDWRGQKRVHCCCVDLAVAVDHLFDPNEFDGEWIRDGAVKVSLSSKRHRVALDLIGIDERYT